MDRKRFIRSEQVLIVVVVATLLPVVMLFVAFVIFGQGTPAFGSFLRVFWNATYDSL